MTRKDFIEKVKKYIPSIKDESILCEEIGSRSGMVGVVNQRIVASPHHPFLTSKVTMNGKVYATKRFVTKSDITSRPKDWVGVEPGAKTERFLTFLEIIATATYVALRDHQEDFVFKIEGRELRTEFEVVGDRVKFPPNSRLTKLFNV